MQPFFSIIVVCLNPGKKLLETLESIKEQTFCDYEVIVKDGLSIDGVAERVPEMFPKESFRLVIQKDQGIYDAMNQAAALARGKYVYFLNCGDRFYSEMVLLQMAEFIKASKREQQMESKVQEIPGIYYGNIFERLTGQRVASNPHMDAFGCYRNVPCHQACFYSRELLLWHPFDISYKVRADYEQFLWCFFAADGAGRVTFAYQDMIIADYEGGGFSETKENKRLSAKEHREITQKYMTPAQLFKFRAIMLLSLAPLRTWIAENERTAGIYNRMKGIVYSRKK
ncbi:MAG: glycosyltransferase [Bacillota bacterium]|nr:glycosyltransferase [Bacillota bacterium]